MEKKKVDRFFRGCELIGQLPGNKILNCLVKRNTKWTHILLDINNQTRNL
jgi:hypothetical protein